jgi:hypothetical protein
MPHIVRGIVNDADMRKADDADDKQAQSHREETLKNNARTRADKQR